MALFNVVKTGHQKDMCYDETGLCALHKYTILGSLPSAHNYEGLCDRRAPKGPSL